MGRALVEADADLAALYAAADNALGFPLSQIIFAGPDEALQQTPVQQPAMVLTSVAYLRALRKRDLLPEADFVAGHSLGEYTAMVATGSLAVMDALALVRRRGELMQEYGAGAMAAILGMDAEAVTAVARDAGAEVANYNAPDQTTISGHAEAVARAAELAKARGAKRVVPLPVSAAFHSSLMAPVAAQMRPLIEATPFHTSRAPLVADFDARLLSDPAELRQELVDQICGSVRWVDVVERLSQEGVTTFYEIGPGKVLAGLVSRCAPGATVVTAERALDEAGVRAG